MMEEGDLYEEIVLDELIAKFKAKKEQQSKTTTGTDSIEPKKHRHQLKQVFED